MVWNELGACRGSDSEVFFNPTYEEVAKTLCSNCVVQGECLAYALDNEVKGVWGGASDEERRDLRTDIEIKYS